MIYYQFLNLRFSEVQALASFQATLGFRAYFVWQGSREISFISFPTIVFSTKFFFLIFRHFIASLLLELRVSFFSFFSPLHKRILLADWVLSIANCRLFCLVVQHPLWNEDHWVSTCWLPAEHNCACKVWYCTRGTWKAAVWRAWMHCNFYLFALWKKWDCAVR